MASGNRTKKPKTKRGTTGKTATKRGSSSRLYTSVNEGVKRRNKKSNGDIGSLIFVFLGVILFLSNLNIGVIGPVGDFFMHLQFGLFGTMAYLFPLLLLSGVICRFFTPKLENSRIISIIGLFWDLCIIMHMSVLDVAKENIYKYCSDNYKGGGIFGGGIATGLSSVIGTIGTWIVAILIFIICFLIISRLSLGDIFYFFAKIFEPSPEDALERERLRIEEIKQQKKEERFQKEHNEVLELRRQKEEERRRIQEELLAEKEAEKELRAPRTENKQRGVPDYDLSMSSSGENEEYIIEDSSDDELPEVTLEAEVTSDNHEEYLDEDFETEDGADSFWSGRKAEQYDKAHVAENNDYVKEPESAEVSVDASEEITEEKPSETEQPENEICEAQQESESEVLESDLNEEAEATPERITFTVDMTCNQEFDISTIMQSVKPEYDRPSEIVVKQEDYLDAVETEVKTKSEASAVTKVSYASEVSAKSEVAVALDVSGQSEAIAEPEVPAKSEVTAELKKESDTTAVSDETEGQALWLEESPISIPEETIQEFNDKSIIGSRGIETKGKIDITGEIVATDSLNNIIEPEPVDNSAKEEKPEKPAATKPEKIVSEPEPKDRVKKWIIPKVDGYLVFRDENGREKDRRPILSHPDFEQSKNIREKEKQSDNELNEAGEKLRNVLNDFGVKIENKIEYTKGPTVTRFEITPQKGVRVKKIVNLSYDIMLGLAAPSLRIEAPVPGQSVVGIEIPNKNREMVSIYDMLKCKEYKEFKGKIAFTAGKALDGSHVVSDIGKMPHVLIAGSTGSGKSVCINTLLMSILFGYTPDELKLIMIDPKVVELQIYNGIPHLKYPVVTDTRQANEILQQAVLEMDERYRKFSDLGVREIVGYNEKIFEAFCEAHPECGSINSINEYYNAARKLNIDINQLNNKPMPYWVIVVDELADLMMTAGKEVEASICRIAQLARACGIHLVVATQRPSVDVITGLIKANMPSRIAFAVSSSIDSRTILDEGGAEKLLGNGDMLFYPSGKNHPERLQGPFVSDREVENVVAFWSDQIKNKSQFLEAQKQSMGSIKTNGESASGNEGVLAASDADEYLTDAARLIIEKDKASIGMLQRRFKIGFNRAARIMDELCERGVVGEEEGTKPRKVLMSMEEFENACENGDI